MPILIGLLDYISLSAISIVFLAILTLTINKNSSKLLNSLPTRKSQIVVSKYIFIIFNTLIINIYLFLIDFRNGINAYGGETLNLNSMLALFISNIIIISFYTFLIFFLSENMAKISIATSVPILNSINEYMIPYIMENNLAFAILGIIFMFSSLSFSLSEFNNREFS